MTNDVSVTVFLDFNNNATIKSEVFQEMSLFLSERLPVQLQKETIEASLKEREDISTTGFGQGFAIPHGKIDNLKESQLIYVRLDTPVDWKALDDQPVEHLFIILVPNADNSNEHLKILSTLSYNLMDSYFTDKIRNSTSEKEIRSTIYEMFEKK